MEFKPGTEIRYTKKYLKWLSEKADELYGYPDKIIPPNPQRDQFYRSLGGAPDMAEQLTQYFMDKYSYSRGLDIEGVIIGQTPISAADNTYLVWVGNELGEDITFIRSDEFEVV